MKIKYISEDGLLMLKNNKESVFNEIIKGGKSLADYLGNNSYLKESPIEIEDIVLDNSQSGSNAPFTDTENVQRIYNHLRGLTDSQASDERIWAAYTLGDQIDYMKYRWSCTTADDMLNHYFFNYSPQRSLFRNGLARLWWIGRVTYDIKREDPYELTKFICKDQDFIEAICGRNVFNNYEVMRAAVMALYDTEKAGEVQVSRELIRAVGKYVNLLAGTYIIDFVDYKTLYEKVKEYINSFVGD